MVLIKCVYAECRVAIKNAPFFVQISLLLLQLETRNFPYACSDNKIHPEQNRTLSIREACMLHTISKDDYDFKINDKKYAKTTTIRDTLGESIPPLVLEIIIKNLINLSKNPNTIYQKTEQQKLIFI